MKRFALALNLCLVAPTAIPSLAAQPKKVVKKESYLTREYLIQQCDLKLSVQERAALNATKTRLEAAQLLQTIYEDRLDKLTEQIQMVQEFIDEAPPQLYHQFQDKFGERPGEMLTRLGYDQSAIKIDLKYNGKMIDLIRTTDKN